jgi:hypothetical protein
MNEKFTPEVVADSPLKHKEGIARQLRQLQVLFCDRLYQQYKNKCKINQKPIDKTFSDILEEHGAQYAGDLRMMAILNSARVLSEEEQSEVIGEKYYKIIDRLYGQLPEGQANDISPEYIKNRIDDLNILIEYLETELKKTQNEFLDKWREMHEMPINKEGQIENKTGVIFFDYLKEYDTPEVRQVLAALEKAGFSKSDDFLEIHLPAQYGEQKIDEEAITESLRSLANIIIDKYPKTRAIVTVSWLLDHPKFKQIFKMHEIGESGNNWSQMIGSNRQIREDRVKEFFASGKMPYRNIIGYIPTEEFLHEYLSIKNKVD